MDNSLEVIQKRRVKYEKRENPKSLFALCFDSIAKNIHFYGNDDTLEYLTPKIKADLLDTLNDRFWRLPTSRNIFTLLVHSRLEKVDFTKTQLDDDLLRISRVCKKLKRIFLTDRTPHNISKEELLNFLQNQVEVEYLQIAFCSVVDDSVLKCLSEVCQNMDTLDVRGCKNITDNGLVFLRSFKCLRHLRLSETMITDTGLTEYIEEPTGPLLKELILDNCRNITNKGLQQVVKFCPNLQIFVFYNCNCTEEIAILFKEPEHLKDIRQLTWNVRW